MEKSLKTKQLKKCTLSQSCIRMRLLFIDLIIGIYLGVNDIYLLLVGTVLGLLLLCLFLIVFFKQLLKEPRLKELRSGSGNVKKWKFCVRC